MMPRTYKVVCISLYNEDITVLDELVDMLKERGLSRANRSALIRYAIRKVNLDTAEKDLGPTRGL
jgi:metal-responsive CopG/Arc/MetJ family transcriptional regulator